MTQFYKNKTKKKKKEKKTWKITLKKHKLYFVHRIAVFISLANIKFKRALGVEWDTESDLFVFRFGDLIKLIKSIKAAATTTTTTKLKVSTSFYDPLGFISLVTAKVIFQLSKIKLIGMIV